MRKKDYTLVFLKYGPQTWATNPFLPPQQQCHHSDLHEDEGTHNLGITKLEEPGRVVECQGVYFCFQDYRDASGSSVVYGPDASCSVTPDPSISRGGRGLKDNVVDCERMDTVSCSWKFISFPLTASLLHCVGLNEVGSPYGVWILYLRSVWSN